MARSSSTLTKLLVGACALALGAGMPCAAAARPVVTFRAKPVPIPVNPNDPHSPTYPGTGEIYGAGAALEAEWRISGSEYAGSPSPLTWIKVYSPAGLRLHPQEFGICSKATLEEEGPEGCPKNSFAGPGGEGEGVVTLGGVRVYERATIDVLFRPGGLFFFVVGRTPAAFEFIAKGTILGAKPPFGQLFTGEVPLIENLPGAPDGSIEQMKITLGAAYERDGKLISYATLPDTCPQGGFVGKSELSFLNGETITVAKRFGCPKRRR